MFWSKKTKEEQLLDSLAENHRKSVRLKTKHNVWVKLSDAYLPDEYLPVEDISIDGLAFKSKELKVGEKVLLTIKITNQFIVKSMAEVLHQHESLSGCLFKDISIADRELIKIFIIEEQSH